MPAINIQKTSGVVRITQTTGYPRSYFGLTGTYNPNPNGTGVNIQIGGDSYQIALSDLQVNGQTPVNMTTALTLLNSIFGT